MNEDPSKLQGDTEGFFNKAKYLFLIMVYGTAYFFYAIFVGIYGWIMTKFKNDP